MASQRPTIQNFADVSKEILAEFKNKVNSVVPAIREARDLVAYPYSNQHQAQGFTIYRELLNGHVPDEGDELKSHCENS